MAVEGGHTCADCGRPITLDTRRGLTWKHRDPADEGPCEDARAEANRREREVRFGTAYSRGWADPIEPAALRGDASLPAGHTD